LIVNDIEQLIVTYHEKPGKTSPPAKIIRQ